MPGTGGSTVLTIRVPADLDRRIAQTARRRRSTKSAVLREALHRAFDTTPEPDDPAREARRQSLLASSRPSDRDALDFVEHAADDRGWR
ncbi:MAG TPA: CopG family transcriptional regulator [Vicinamibacterales bacterium]